MPISVSPIITILYYYGIFGKTERLLVHYYQLNSTLYLISTYFFPLMSFSVSGCTLHSAAMPLSFLWDSFSDLPFFLEELDSFEYSSGILYTVLPFG